MREGPIAVIGLACRLPGAPGPEQFWRLLSEGRDAISMAPPERFAPPHDEGVPTHGGFLDQVEYFDAEFFGISPREAAVMDPQQRLVLELAWEALEDAGIVPDTLRGSRTAVFVGAQRDDYANLLYRQGTEAITQHTMTGLNRGIIANRLSYFLDLRGPSLTVDTAQSSSLVAVHLACESLRTGESDTAIAAGVNLNVLAEHTVTEDRFGALSPDGASYAFDARANGFVPGEGGGVVVLKPLELALADGDRVHGVILGSAVNNDGATPGLSVPSGAAQERVIRQAYERAGVDPRTVQYVEAHGTGTPVGDPIEAGALGAVLGAGRDSDDPLRIGSAKTNVGHLEGAAGLTGLLKVLLGLERRLLPPSRNFTTPNPGIPFAELGLAVQTELSPWPHSDRPLISGVSSFGMGGTNCHIVVTEAPRTVPAARASETRTSPAVLPWVVSGRGGNALRAQAERLHDFAAGESAPRSVDIGWTLASTRTAFADRAIVSAENRAGLLLGLRALADGRPSPYVVSGTARSGRLGIVFAGQGSQRVGMGSELYAAFPRFADAFDEVCAQLDPLLPRPLREVIASGEGLDETRFAQPALFSVEVALYRLTESWGLRPDRLAGHSVGEIAAAHVAGVLSLADAARLVAVRGRLMQALPAGGAMVAVEATEEEVALLLAGREAEVGLAAVNGPTALVLSGTGRAVTDLAAELAARGRRTKRLKVSHAFHSPLMAPMLARFREETRTLEFHEPSIPVVSTVTGRTTTAGELCSPDHWVDQVSSPVRFLDAVRTLEAEGVTTYLELGPDGTCSAMVDAAVRDPEAAVSVPSLRAGRPEPQSLTTALATTFVHGGRVDLASVYEGTGARRTDLPTYAFQRRRYWIDGGTRAAVPPKDSFATDGLAERPVALSEAERRRTLTDLVHAHIAAVLGHEADQRIAPDTTFRDLGFDSLMAVELRDALAGATGLRLPSGLLFQWPTPGALVDHLLARLLGTGEDATDTVAPGTDDGEPIAIIGMACRYPGGVTSPEELWQLVADGVDAISAFPTDRGWDPDLYDPDSERPGTSYVGHGGFLHGAGEFDAAFFGISPREALGMDPQQRLLLETAWEAVERAGLDARSLHGTRTGVFVGGTAPDYGPRMHDAGHGVEGHVLTGSTASVMSGRIAYQLGLIGPAVTVDTACSSSLVALHMAVRSLRSKESSLALAGGVAVMSGPGMFVEFSRQRGLAADGRSKPFAASADGTSWAEGVGLLLVERLSDARRHGHRVLGIIRGTAVNQDGASNGLTAPNGVSQERVIRQALADARLRAGDVDAVEAHGTGTTLGDPIEAEALLATYGQGRDGGEPVFLGSLKSNIGHAQAAAGIGGIIKMVEALRRAQLPATLHVDRPTPHIDWDGSGLHLLTESRPWPDTPRPRRAAVSSFGISGTNAHVILEQAPPTQTPATDTTADGDNGAGVGVNGAGVPWVLSAKTSDALHDQALRLHDHLDAHPELAPAEVAHALLSTRSSFSHRAVVLGEGITELRSALHALGTGRPHPHVITGSSSGTAAGTVFVFPGQGTQRPGMARQLLDTHPVFAEHIQACQEALSPYTTLSLADLLHERPGGPALDRIDVVQPALFAVMTGLAQLWRAHGVEPDAVVGHSQGEIAAAYIAGALTLEDAMRLVVLRARTLVAITGQGGMLWTALPAHEAAAHGVGEGERLQVAAVNAPGSTVIAGDNTAIEELTRNLAEDGVRTRRIAVDYASHSAHIDRVEPQMREELAGITPVASRVAFYSTVTGDRLDTAELTADYWFENMRRTVRFQSAVQALHRDGHGLYIETSPHPALVTSVQETLDIDDTDGPAVTATGTLRRDTDDPTQFTKALAGAHTAGKHIHWPQHPTPTPAVDLPTYAFQRTRHWLVAEPANDPSGLGLAAVDHPLLGAVMDLADEDGRVFTGALSLGRQPWLADHIVATAVLVPGAALVEMALEMGAEVGCDTVVELTNEVPLVLPGNGTVELQGRVGPDRDGHREISVYGRTESEAPWVRHATGVLAVPSPASGAGSGAASDAAGPLSAWPPPGAVPVDPAKMYERMAGIGVAYGPAFRGIQRAWRLGDEVLTEVRLEHEDAGRFGLHPAVFDAAVHGLRLREEPAADPTGGTGTPVDPGTADYRRILVPFSWRDVRLEAQGARLLRVRIAPAGADTVSVEATDGTGRSVLSVGSLTFRPLTEAQLRASTTVPRDWLLRLDWVPLSASHPTPDPGAAWAVVCGAGTSAEAFAEFTAELSAAGVNVTRYDDLDALALSMGTGTAPQVVAVAVTRPAGTPDEAFAARATVAAAHETVRQWLTDDRFEGHRLVMATRGAVAAGGVVPDLASAPVWGLVRSAQEENPGRFALVDLDHDASAGALPAAVATGETQAAIRAGEILLPRLAPADSDGLAVPSDPTWRLGIPARGTFENLELGPAPDALDLLGPGQIRIAVRAGGINFKDALYALEMISAEQRPGLEGAGVVLEVAPDVTDLAPGDRVLGLIPDALGPVAVTDRRLVAPMPDGWSFAEAASVPVVFLTAYHGLVELAALSEGESVLVHAAAGGVGLAAVQLARHLGAEVLGTASDAKHDVLRAWGLDDAHIASSRTLDFARRFDSVDVVLNSLAGEFVDSSAGLLRPGGRFLEMGKTDLRDPVDMAGKWPGTSYQAFDITQLSPDHIQDMLIRILALFRSGALRHLPLTVLDVRRARTAFQELAQARYVGKVVLTIPRGPEPGGTVLITGGLGALGRNTARRLVTAHGVRHLLLTGRRGRASEGVADLEAELSRLGAEVTVAACDVSDREALSALLASVPPEHPLTGVIHTAGALADGVVTALTPENFDAAMTPKIDASWHLHELTRDLDLSLFVLYSSAIGTLGGAGQANYAAANAFLDALAHRRRACGDPAVSLAWGLWAEDSGMTGGLSENDVVRLARSGISAMSSEEGLALFDAALACDDPLLVAMKPDRQALRSGRPLSPLLKGLAHGPVRRAVDEAEQEGPQLVRRLAELSPAERERALLDVVRTHAAAVLGHTTQERVPATAEFKSAGFDSLTGVELRNQLSAATGLRLPATLIFDFPTPRELAAHLANEYFAKATEPAPPVPGAEPEAGRDAASEGEEGHLRRMLASIPLARLRSAGLVDVLRGLAEKGPDEEAGQSPDTGIDGLDAGELVRLATHGTDA
ncbi:MULTISPECIES: type I polyketide synthase [Streptomyces]|uniref:Type I polyketide synthase n=1 Tax=Streptomyces sp. NBC_00093 TaxID=2975649 RepID=A0AAU2AE02_9ACTN